ARRGRTRARSSVQVGDVVPGGGAWWWLTTLAPLPQMDQADEALPVGDLAGGPPLWAAQDLGGAPVSGEPPCVRGQQHDVGGAGGGVQVLLVLCRIAAE